VKDIGLERIFLAAAWLAAVGVFGWLAFRGPINLELYGLFGLSAACALPALALLRSTSTGERCIGRVMLGCAMLPIGLLVAIWLMLLFFFRGP